MLKAALGRYQRRRLAWLFFSLLLTLGVYPALKALAPGFHLLELLLAVNLLAAIASLAQERGMRVLLWLGVGAMLALREAPWLLGCLLATVATARYALRPGIVDAERIFAALDAYLLAGLVFGVWYWVLEQTWPGSFAAASAGGLDLARAVYFSSVTIATLGYGDIVPASDAARGWQSSRRSADRCTSRSSSPGWSVCTRGRRTRERGSILGHLLRGGRPRRWTGCSG